MATFYTNSNNPREANPMIYLPGAYPDAPVVPPNLMMLNSFCDSIPSNSQPHEIPSLEGLYANQQHHEMLSNMGGNVFRDDMLLMNSINGQGLSLSLGTQIPSAIQIPSIPYRNMNPRDEQPRNSDYPDANKCEMSSYGLHRNVPNSKYLKATQQLLEEVVNVRKAMRVSRSKEELPAKERENEFSNPNSSSNSQLELSNVEKQDLQNKLTKLLSMLEEVDRRYKQYEHQMQIVVSSFDAFAGAGSAKPYTALALQTISQHFRALRDAIICRINASRRALGDQEGSENVKVGIPRLRFVDQQLKQQRAIQQMGMMQQNAWRPQRGLPETSVSILRAWLFEHFLHPYPKDSDKIMLARQTGLTRSQVSNWFINARVRLWKPMIEEMYKEETGDAEIDSISSSENAAKGEDTQISANSGTENVGEMTGMPLGNYGSFVNETGGVYEVADRSRAVSLTLGLQHCEGGGSHGVVITGDDVYGGSDPSASEFERINAVKRQQIRFSASSHLLHDFVA